MALLAVSVGVYLWAMAVWLWLAPHERLQIEQACRRIERGLRQAGMTVVKPPLDWEARAEVEGVSLTLEAPAMAIPPGQVRHQDGDRVTETAALLRFEAPGPELACAPRYDHARILGPVTLPVAAPTGHEGFDAKYVLWAAAPVAFSWWALDALVQLDLRWMVREGGSVTVALGRLPVEAVPTVRDLAVRWPGASRTPPPDGPLAPPLDDLGVPRFPEVRRPIWVSGAVAVVCAPFVGMFGPVMYAPWRPSLSYFGCGDASMYVVAHPEGPGETSYSAHCSGGREASYQVWAVATVESGAVVVAVGVLLSLYRAARRGR